MLKKRFFKTKPTCQVTFHLPKEVEAKRANLVGEFNDWDETADPMKKVKGVWKTTLELDQGKAYEFRYLVNGSEWHNDDAADRYVPNDVGSENSVVTTTQG
jgi:1,4-alpha-glucan branching enzyme